MGYVCFLDNISNIFRTSTYTAAFLINSFGKSFISFKKTFKKLFIVINSATSSLIALYCIKFKLVKISSITLSSKF